MDQLKEDINDQSGMIRELGVFVVSMLLCMLSAFCVMTVSITLGDDYPILATLMTVWLFTLIFCSLSIKSITPFSLSAVAGAQNAAVSVCVLVLAHYLQPNWMWLLGIFILVYLIISSFMEFTTRISWVDKFYRYGLMVGCILSWLFPILAYFGPESSNNRAEMQSALENFIAVMMDVV